MKTFRSPCALVLLFTSVAFGSVIRVPQDEPTIQDGINAASNGDTVLVFPGTYEESIDFIGKAITVRSAEGANLTKIVGGGSGTIVTFMGGEGRTSVLRGFTITNGTAGGIVISSSSPTVERNIVTNNFSCDGDGIAINFGSPLIQDNEITDNYQFGCSGGTGGGGIEIGGAASAEIIHNFIARNNAGDGDGGGISLFAAGTPTISNNVILNNFTSATGGGISMYNQSDALVVQNLIVGNTATQGGGVYFLVPEGDRGPLLINNTIVGTTGSTQGSAVWAAGFDSQAQLFNNIMQGSSGQNAVWCDGSSGGETPIFTDNDAWAQGGTGLQGTCAGQDQQNGNISENAEFVRPLEGKFELRSTSPAINAGDNNAPDLPTTDLAGHQRIVGGIVDIGAFEYQGNESR